MTEYQCTECAEVVVHESGQLRHTRQTGHSMYLNLKKRGWGYYGAETGKPKTEKQMKDFRMKYLFR